MTELDGIAIDACVIYRFRNELAAESGVIYDLVTTISHKLGIVIDEGDKILYEWEAGSSDTLISDWATDEMKNGRIKKVRGAIDSAVKRRIHNHYGLPRTGYDIEYIKCANVTELKYILTCDIHFFDPKEKQASHARKHRIKAQRIGRLCRYLKRELSIVVGMPDHCEEDLDFCDAERVVQGASK